MMLLSSMLSTLLTLGCLLIVATTAQATTKQDLVAVQMFTHVWWSGCSDEKSDLATLLSQDGNLSKQINFTLYPVPDPVYPVRDPTKCDTSSFSKDICTCEIHEACAVFVSQCEHGCTGKALEKLGSFLGCYVSRQCFCVCSWLLYCFLSRV